jgi:LAO/AO transport system kinase
VISALNKEFYINGHKNKNFSVLARFISLIESSRSSHQKIVREVFEVIKSKKTIVVGISGTPGAGKSTFINQLGLSLIKSKKKFKLAVIAIDPSSEISGGSILGDKTRMGELSVFPQVFIRPISSKGSVGGVTPKIHNIVRALKSWGFDLILIETVGVGQSESTVRAIVDKLVLVVPPGTGDDLQALKRGLLELVDVVCINKIDLVSKELVRSSFDHYLSSLHILRSKEIPVFLTNSNSAKGIGNIVKWFKAYINKEQVSKSINVDVIRHKKLYLLELQSRFMEWMNCDENTKHLKLPIDQLLKKFAQFLLK